MQNLQPNLSPVLRAITACSQQQQRCKKDVLSKVIQRFSIKQFHAIKQKAKAALSQASQDYVQLSLQLVSQLQQKILINKL